MIITENYAIAKNGESVKKYTLSNQNGMSVEILNLGGIITSIKVPNKNGALTDVVLGYQNPEDYFENPFYFGAIIGRYGNRIANAKFEIANQVFSLEANNGGHNLHGGTNSFHTKIWTAEILDNSLKLTYLSPDGEEGFPGNLHGTVTYTLTDANDLEVEYGATTDKTTVVNMTQHSYFNLSGDFSTSILDHELQLNSDYYLPTDETMIPTGELKSVEDTAFDFRQFKTLGQDIENQELDIVQGYGYDHTLVINGEGLRKVATVKSAKSGIVLEVHSTEPGVQLYTGNHINASKKNQQGGDCLRRSGFCLETQHFPDSPNQTAFPSTLLKVGEAYSSRTILKFLVEK